MWLQLFRVVVDELASHMPEKACIESCTMAPLPILRILVVAKHKPCIGLNSFIACHGQGPIPEARRHLLESSPTWCNWIRA